MGEGGQQRLTDRWEVFRRDVEPPVVTAQPLDEGQHRRQVVHTGHDAAERADQPVALRGHRRRKHSSRLRMRG